MKKVLGIFAIALSLVSCSAEEIEMRTTNPHLGVDVVGTKEMTVLNQNNGVIATDNVQKTIKYNPKENTLSIDNKAYTVTEVTHYTISYLNESKTYVIEFNTGYIFDGGSTRTKFDMYQKDMKKQYYEVYTYKN